MKFNFKCVGETGGDCITPYKLVFDKPITVKEFIDEVLKREEWGYIGIYKPGTIFGDPCCEYKKAKLLNHLPKEILNKPIASANASGGWTRMDYILNLKN